MFKYLRDLLIQICNHKLDMSLEQFDVLVEQAFSEKSITKEQYKWLMAQEDDD